MNMVMSRLLSMYAYLLYNVYSYLHHFSHTHRIANHLLSTTYTHRKVVVRHTKVKMAKISTPIPSLKASAKVSRRMEVVTNSFVIHSVISVLQRSASVLQIILGVLNHIGRMT